MPTDRILAGIGRFHRLFEENRELFESMAAEGQNPQALFIGCCDSRAAPEWITQCDPGDLFVTRNVGNIVPPYGSGQSSIGAVIEFAVLQLEVRHVILCGHTDCGAIRDLDRAADWLAKPHIARWIEYCRPAKTQIEATGLPAEDRHLATVRANVLLQLENLRSYDPVRTGESSGTLTLHGWVYRLMTGIIEAYDSETGSWSPQGGPPA